MNIPHYDIDKSKPETEDWTNFLDEEYLMLVCGQSGCGKTNTIMHMLRNPLVYFVKICLYTPNEKWAAKKIMDRVSDKVGYDVMEINDKMTLWTQVNTPKETEKS